MIILLMLMTQTRASVVPLYVWSVCVFTLLAVFSSCCGEGWVRALFFLRYFEDEGEVNDRTKWNEKKVLLV